MKQKPEKLFIRILEVAVETICFICISYLLECAIYSFGRHPLFILFFAVNCWAISHYWEALRRHLSKGVSAVFFVLALAICAVLLWKGLLPLSQTPVQW